MRASDWGLRSDDGVQGSHARINFQRRGPEVGFWELCDHSVTLWLLGFRTYCDKNVIVPCSERVNVDQEAAELSSGRRLKNQIE
jgi:hypothetical protein